MKRYSPLAQPIKWYLYAIAAGSPGEIPAGVDGRAVRTLVHGDLRLLASQWEEHTPPAGTAAVLSHEAVVEAAMHTVTVLPFRFGTLADAVLCLSFLEQNAEAIHSRLAKVAGQAEVTVKLLDPTGRRPAPGGAATVSGMTYLLRKQQQARREQERAEQAGRLIEQVDAALAPWVTDRRRQVAPSPNVLAALTYLVPTAVLSEWTQAALGVRQRLGEVDLMASGPWPPYHFAEVTDREQPQS